MDSAPPQHPEDREDACLSGPADDAGGLPLSRHRAGRLCGRRVRRLPLLRRAQMETGRAALSVETAPASPAEPVIVAREIRKEFMLRKYRGSLKALVLSGGRMSRQVVPA